MTLEPAVPVSMQQMSLDKQVQEVERLITQLEDLSAKLTKAAQDATASFKRSGGTDDRTDSQGS